MSQWVSDPHSQWSDSGPIKSAWDRGSENPNFPEAWVLRFGGKNCSPLSFKYFQRSLSTITETVSIWRGGEVRRRRGPATRWSSMMEVFCRKRSALVVADYLFADRLWGRRGGGRGGLAWSSRSGWGTSCATRWDVAEKMTSLLEILTCRCTILSPISASTSSAERMEVESLQ